MIENAIVSTLDKSYEIGKSGIYINPARVANNLDNWARNTPQNVKKTQVENIALAGLLISTIILIIILRDN